MRKVSSDEFDYCTSKRMYFIPTNEYAAWSKEAFIGYLSIRQDQIYRHMVGTMQHILHESDRIGPEETVNRLKALEQAFLEIRESSQ